jgi:hypothetical protein
MRSDREPDGDDEPLKSYPGRRAGVWVAALLACIAFAALEGFAFRHVWPPPSYRPRTFDW